MSGLSLDAGMVCITSTSGCLLLPLLSAIWPVSPALLCSGSESGPRGSPPHGLAEDSFEQHLGAESSQSTCSQDYLQLLSRATQVFWEESLLEQDMACMEMQRRRSLLETAERLANKYEDALY